MKKFNAIAMQSAAALAMIAPMMGSAIAVHAADTANTAPQAGVTQGASQTNITEGKVQLVESTEAPTIVDPNKPTDPLDPAKPTNPDNGGTDEHITGNKGPLSLDVVPSFDFGIRAIDSVDTDIHAKIQNYKKTPADTADTPVGHYVQITDKRSSEKKNFKLTVKDSGFIADGDKKLDRSSAVITLGESDILNSTNADPEAPMATKGAAVTLGDADATILDNADALKGASVIMFGGKAVDLIKQESQFKEDGAKDADVTVDQGVKLHLPANQQAGKYTDTITWTLASAD